MADTLAAGSVTFNPLYKEVKIRVTRGLAAGEWKPGEAIPSEIAVLKDIGGVVLRHLNSTSGVTSP